MVATTGTSDAGRSARRETLLLLAGLVLVALNLRVALTSIGPVIADIRHDDGLSGAAVGLLTAAPLIAFALIAPLGPAVAARFGIERALLGCMALLIAGLALRPLPPVVLLFLGTISVGAGIAIGNVLIPALVKRRFAERAAFMAAVYSVALGVGAALGAGLTVPIERWLGGSWREALAVWTIPAVLAALIWLPQVRRSSAPDAVLRSRSTRVYLWRDRIAWYVTGFTALQSLAYYSMVTWLPEIYREHGISKANAGGLMSLALTVVIPLGLVVAAIATRLRDQRLLAVAAVAFQAAAFLGVLLAPTAAPLLWALLLGVSLAIGFTLVLMLFVLRASDPRHAAELSGMAQSLGYAVAAIGPVVLGALRDITGSWSVPLIVLVALTVPELVVGLGASRTGYVGGTDTDDAQPTAGTVPDAAALGVAPCGC